MDQIFAMLQFDGVMTDMITSMGSVIALSLMLAGLWVVVRILKAVREGNYPGGAEFREDARLSEEELLEKYEGRK